MEDRVYWFIEDGKREMCAVPFTEQQHDRAIFWYEYLQDSNPDRGPYTLFRATATTTPVGKMIPLHRIDEQ